MARETRNRLGLAALGAAAIGCVAPFLGGPSEPTAGAAPGGPKRPNVVVVMTDDQPASHVTSRAMPATIRHLARKGTTFTDSVVTTPLCCPSRAAFLTGQYPHNNGVFDNEPGYTSLREPRSTLFSWLRSAGYRTGHVGRFLLNYDRSFAGEGAGEGGIPEDEYLPGSYEENAPPRALPRIGEPGSGWPAPPGVDDWFGYANAQTLYLGAEFSDNGRRLVAGTNGSSYTTRIINREARDFVRDHAPGPQPFFLSVAHVAPHTTNFHPSRNCGSGAALAEPRLFRRFRKEPLPEPRSYDERRIGDKPAWVDFRNRLRRRHELALRKGWRCALAAAASVDRGIAGLIKTLRRTGELGRTAIFFTSDNGYLYGQHRIVLEKVYPYEESIRVPLIARVPRAYLGAGRKRERPREVAKTVANIDLTATILGLADATPCAGGVCRALDGRSLLPLLRGQRRGWPASRGVLVQIGSNRTCGQRPGPRGLNSFYDAIRTRRHLYVELNRVNRETGACDRPEYELYDLRKDPHQLRNVAADPTRRAPSALQTELAARLAALRACAGAASAEATPPPGAPPRCE